MDESGEGQGRRPETLIRQELMEVVAKVEASPGYQSDRQRQEQVLSKVVGDNIIEELRGFLLAAQIEDDEFKKIKGEQNFEMDRESRLRGEIFERLVRAEFAQGTPLEEELTTLFHEPARFGLKEQVGKALRNPDLAFVELDEQTHVVRIYGAGEAKLGKLGKQVFKQLSEGGFKRGMLVIAEVVNETKDLDEHGLGVLARAGRLELDEHMKTTLVVPADRDENDLSSFIREGQFTKPKLQEFRELLENREKVEILKSSFGIKEVVAMTDLIMKKIDAVG